MFKYRIPQIAWLTVLWMILWGSVSVATILSGVALAMFTLVFFPAPVLDLDLKIRPGKLLKLLLYFCFYLVQSSLTVAWYSLRWQPCPTSKVYPATLRLQSDLVRVLAYDFIVLIPGTIIVDVNDGYFLTHLIDQSTEETFYKQINTVEKLFHEAFESHIPYPEVTTTLPEAI